MLCVHDQVIFRVGNNENIKIDVDYIYLLIGTYGTLVS